MWAWILIGLFVLWCSSYLFDEDNHIEDIDPWLYADPADFLALELLEEDEEDDFDFF